MRANIGIIAASGSLANLQTVDEQLRQRCDITYLPYSTTMELTNLYLEHASRFDGFLFSGEFPRNYLVENVCSITKPYQCLQLADREFYRVIARLYARNAHMDFGRVMFDLSDTAVRQELVRVFQDVFPGDEQPCIYAVRRGEHSASRYEAAMERYREQWKSGAVELIVTGLSNLARQLEREGIPHVLLQPAPGTILECLSALLTDVQTARMEQTRSACCTIGLAEEQAAPQDYQRLEKALEQFNARQNMAFVLRRNGNMYDAVTSGAVAKELTQGYTTCLLTSWLLEAMPFSTHVGWGMGFDVVTAHRNAMRAIQQSRRDTNRNTYMVNEADEMIGPLCGDRTISYRLRPDARTSRMAKVLGISSVNLEKLISLQEKKQLTQVSASDLVFYLDITPRSAARILQKLSAHGAVVQVGNVHLNGRGRPAAVYRLELEAFTL